MVGGRDASKYLHVYDNFFSSWATPLCFLSYHDIYECDGDSGCHINMSCHIFMQLEKYGDVVDSLNNMKANNIISE